MIDDQAPLQAFALAIQQVLAGHGSHLGNPDMAVRSPSSSGASPLSQPPLPQCSPGCNAFRWHAGACVTAVSSSMQANARRFCDDSVCAVVQNMVCVAMEDMLPRHDLIEQLRDHVALPEEFLDALHEPARRLCLADLVIPYLSEGKSAQVHAQVALAQHKQNVKNERRSSMAAQQAPPPADGSVTRASTRAVTRAQKQRAQTQDDDMDDGIPRETSMRLSIAPHPSSPQVASTTVPTFPSVLRLDSSMQQQQQALEQGQESKQQAMSDMEAGSARRPAKSRLGRRLQLQRERQQAAVVLYTPFHGQEQRPRGGALLPAPAPAQQRSHCRQPPHRTRCSYFPYCSNPECPFVHPSKLCSRFPNCDRSGDTCLFLHPSLPPCKFAERCTNVACPFPHPSPSAMTLCQFRGRCTNRQCRQRHPRIACRFGERCSNPVCSFSHRPACRFGDACRTASCGFAHPAGAAAATTSTADRDFVLAPQQADQRDDQKDVAPSLVFHDDDTASAV